MSTKRFGGLGFWLAFAALSIGAMTANAQTGDYQYKILYAFCPANNCTGGLEPNSKLVLDGNGNLYGTALSGGQSGLGTVYQLSPTAKGKWKEKVLFNFCSTNTCGEDARPSGNLIIDRSGALYGATGAGGSAKGGVIYKLSPGANGKKWKISALHVFCQFDSGCARSGEPAGLTYIGASSGDPYDGISPLYGVSYLGGKYGEGFVFELTVSGKSRLTDIYDFGAPGCSVCDASGSGPPVMDATGNMYLVLSNSIEKLQPHEAGKKWKATSLYTFCQLENCADGNMPGAFTMDAADDIYGITTSGGFHGACFNGNDGCGVLYKLASDGSAWKEAVLYDFCQQPSCKDGDPEQEPVSPIVDSSGALFGVTEFGGGNDIDPNGLGGGTVFNMSGTMKTMYSFCAKADCADGLYPLSALTAGTNGELYGTASLGGPNANGVVFELTPK